MMFFLSFSSSRTMLTEKRIEISLANYYSSKLAVIIFVVLAKRWTKDKMKAKSRSNLNFIFY